MGKRLSVVPGIDYNFFSQPIRDNVGENISGQKGQVALKCFGEEPFEAVFQGTRERLRAVLVTALLASLGLLPAALSHAIGSETQRPIAKDPC
jgi:Cu/Ag efflux pump CusA